MIFFVFASLPAQSQTPGDAGQLEALDSQILQLWGDGKNNESLPLNKRVVELSDKMLGPEHPQSVERAETAAYALGLAGRQQEAKTLFVRVIKSRERALSGKINFGSAEKLLEANQLGRLYEEVGRFADAELLYQRVLTAQEKAHGSMHPEVAKALSKLSLLYAKQERYAEQEPVLKRQLTILEKTPGATYFADPNLPAEFVAELARIDTYQAVSDLADLYGILGKQSEMEALAKRTLASLKKEGTTFEILTSVNYEQLGRIAVSRGRYAEAESYFKKAIEIEQRTPDGQRVFFVETPNGLADVYLRQGR